ncbi:reverse transcriptase domain-containing protein [Vibrio vulnificus]
MEQISASANLNHALRRVKRNKGCAGVDRLDITATISKLRQASNGQALRQSLLDGSYQPQPVLGIEIPKTNGGVRQLGIPTVLDRIVQQAITSVLSDIYEPKFSNSSYGFRPNRSAHHALAAASRYIREGRGYVVDIDLAKYFDTVNHDRLMHRLSKDIIDKRVLKLIRAYLQAGLMRDGLVERRQRGTPQGGPLSPLLSNIVLDELDKESITEFLEQKLKLTVNREKSAATRVPERGYLSHSFKIDTWLQRQGVTERNAWKLAMSDKGWWHLALSPQVNHAMPIKWFEERGLYSLRDGYESLTIYSEPPYATYACTVV